MFIEPMLKTFKDYGQLVALLDIDPLRFKVTADKFPITKEVATFLPDEFDRMMQETKPDVVIVVGADHSHAHYIIKALAYDVDVITEKPMATTSEQCRDILQAEAKSKGKVTVAFNYRYAPIHRRLKEMVLEGKVGRITSVDLNWYVDTHHGASYFKRWNRTRANSGGLSIHKSTHHFDLVNWWIAQKPVEAFAYGALNYFGPDGELNPKQEDGRFCGTCQVRQDCSYYTRWSSRSKDPIIADDHVTIGSEKSSPYSNYRRDACIFDSAIDIEDTYTAVVKYDKGALLSYSINFSLPYEGYRLAINGTKGRLESQHFHSSRVPFEVPVQTIEYYPMFGSKEVIHVLHNEGGHGGGDPILLEDLFLGPDPRRSYEILSGAQAGTESVLTGEAVWRSAKEGRPIRIAELLTGKAEISSDVGAMVL
jgi:predicted dehydrogenase